LSLVTLLLFPFYYILAMLGQLFITLRNSLISIIVWWNTGLGWGQDWNVRSFAYHIHASSL